MFSIVSRTSQRWGLASREASVLVQLLLLAVSILAYSVIAMAIANSLFVNHVGANHLPLAFIAIGLASVPIYGLFATLIDRYSRPQLFRTVLAISASLALALRYCLQFDAVWVYYGLLIVVFFQWDFYNNILYPSLAIDYFSATDYKKYTPFMGIAQGIGTLLGGLITLVLARYLATVDLLWILLVVLGIAFGQVSYLRYSHPPLNPAKPKEQTSSLATIKSFPFLVKKYPLAGLLAASSFLLVIIYLSSEFLWFSIYGDSFSERELTAFLGEMRIIISMVQVAVLYGVTRPLLRKFGVANLNIVYPLTTLLSFLGLGLNFGLPAAIALHTNGDAFYKGINIPIHQLNYNAIAPEFRGKIRALSDGLIYALGLTTAGVVLWLAHNYLSLSQITAIAAGLTLLLLFVRLPMGRSYGLGLAQIIEESDQDLSVLPVLAPEQLEITPKLQEKTANAITAYEKQGEKYIQSQLKSSDRDKIKIAVAALNKIGTKAALNSLYKSLQTDFEQLTQIQKWQQQLDPANLIWQPLHQAIANYQQQRITKFLDILDILEPSSALTKVKRIVTSSDRQNLANAIEFLASSKNRRFVTPLIPILEQRLKPPTRYGNGHDLSESKTKLKPQENQILLAALESQDPLLKQAALEIATDLASNSLLDDLSLKKVVTKTR